MRLYAFLAKHFLSISKWSVVIIFQLKNNMLNRCQILNVFPFIEATSEYLDGARPCNFQRKGKYFIQRILS
jgi:hypothetical protein